MKVVLFCGGLGTRLREHSDTIPKPLVNVGAQPLLWHLMRYYAHYGHTEFIFCLGYRGDLIREYFLKYSEAMSNDFTLSQGGKKIELHSRDFSNWSLTFVDTGMHNNIGQRLLRVKHLLQGEEMFLANYSDGLTDLDLNRHIADFKKTDAVATFAAVRNSQTFHAVQIGDDGFVSSMGELSQQDLWINGGFFVLRNQIFDHLNEGEELVNEPFQRLIKQGKLIATRWPGFWHSMDTFKDKITLDRMDAKGECPWMVWRAPAGGTR